MPSTPVRRAMPAPANVETRCSQLMHAGSFRRRAQFAHDLDAGAGADAVRSGIDHLHELRRGADAAGRLHADACVRRRRASAPRRPLSRRKAAKPVEVLTKSTPASSRQRASQNFLLLVEQRGFQDHLADRAVGVRQPGQAAHLGLHQHAVARLQRADVNAPCRVRARLLRRPLRLRPAW